MQYKKVLRLYKVAENSLKKWLNIDIVYITDDSNQEGLFLIRNYESMIKPKHRKIIDLIKIKVMQKF